MNFGMIVVNQSIKIMQNYATWILIVLWFETEDFYKDIADDVERRPQTKTIAYKKNKKVTELT